MKKSEMEKLSKEELRAISLQKNKKGVATAEALKAQQILFEMDPCCSAPPNDGVDGYNDKRYNIVHQY